MSILRDEQYIQKLGMLPWRWNKYKNRAILQDYPGYIKALYTID